jgi:gluconokinase
MIILVMGISGAGKSTIGAMLAKELAARFIEGDDYHPPENIEKMRNGVPLDDADRGPWLDLLAGEITKAQDRGEWVVLACSALKEAYRHQLLRGITDHQIIWLHGDRDVIAARLATRQGHFMPSTLQDSQLAALSPPSGIPFLDVSLPVSQIVRRALTLITAR